MRLNLRNLSSSEDSEYSQASANRAISWVNTGQEIGTAMGVEMGRVVGEIPILAPVARRDRSGSSVISLVSDTELERLGVGVKDGVLS